MQSKQEFARVADGRLGRKTGRGIYDYNECGAIRLLSPS
jgi:3-hydroxyacyl-CoA dehydrogenase